MGIIARQAAWNTVLSYVGIALGFVNVVVLYPKVLGSDEFGLTRLLVSVATLTAMVAQFGAENTVVRYFPYFRDPARGHRGLLGMLLLFGTATGLLAMLVLGLGHGLLAEVFSDRNALYGQYGLLVLPMVLSEVYFILLRSYSRSLHRTIPPTFIREFLLRLLQLAIVLVQALWPLPFVWFMVLYAGTFLVCTLLLLSDLHRAGLLTFGWKHRWLPRRIRRSMAWYSAFTLSSGLAGMALGNLDQLMIGALLSDGLRYVAHYAVGFYFGTVIATPARALNQVAVPLLAEAWRQGDLAKIQDLYRRSSLVQTVVSGFLLLGLWACLDDLYALLPAEYASTADVALLIGLGYFLSSSLGLSIGIIAMSKAYRMDAITSIVLLALNVLGNFILIRELGVIGSAWATLIALVLVNSYRTGYLWRRYRLWPFDVATLKVLLLMAAVGAVVHFVPHLPSPGVDLVVRGSVCTALFWPGAYVFGLMPELVAMLQRFRNGR